MNRQLQIELWSECRCSRCKFCNLVLSSEMRGDGIHNNPNIPLTAEQKIEYIKRGIEYLFKAKWEFYDQLLLRGGEIFNSYPSAIVPYWTQFITEISKLIKNGTIKKLFLITSLKYDFKDSLLELTLQLLEDSGVDITEQVMIGTSWDAKFRFTETSARQWTSTREVLRLRHVPVHITSILMQSFIDMYFTRSRDILELMDGEFDFIAPQGKPELLHLDGFFPNRNDCIKFLLELKNSDKYHGIFNRLNHQNHRRAESIYFTEDKRLCIRDLASYETILPGEVEKRLDCGHPLEYACYNDSDACFLCDLKALDKMV